MTIGRGLEPKTGATSRSDRMARWFEVPLLLAALLAIPVIVVQESNFGRPWEGVADVLDWVIWGAFVLQLVVMLAVFPDRRRWLTNHPLEVLIVLLTPPFLPATLKVARVLPVVRAVWVLVLAHRARPLLPAGDALRGVALLRRRGGRRHALRRRRAGAEPEHLGRALVGDGDGYYRRLRGHLPPDDRRTHSRHRGDDHRCRLRRAADRLLRPALPAGRKPGPRAHADRSRDDAEDRRDGRPDRRPPQGPARRSPVRPSAKEI